MRIVYCGQLGEGSTSLMRMNALVNLGHEVHGLDSAWYPLGAIGFITRLARRAGWAPDPGSSSVKLLEAVKSKVPDLVWIDKGLSICPGMLNTFRENGIQLVHYSPDDMNGRHNQSRFYLHGIPFYDLHVTTKSYNVEELKAMGARSVIFVNNAYCRTIHRPVEITAEKKNLLGGPVGFIGAYEQERANSIKFLASNDVPVRVWGGEWNAWAKPNKHPLLKVECRHLWGGRLRPGHLFLRYQCGVSETVESRSPNNAFY